MMTEEQVAADRPAVLRFLAWLSRDANRETTRVILLRYTNEDHFTECISDFDRQVVWEFYQDACRAGRVQP